MEETDKKLKWKKVKTANIASIVIIVAIMALICLLFFVDIPNENKDILNTTISFFMGTGFSGVVFYLFGYKGRQEQPSDEFDASGFGMHNEIECPNCNHKF